MYGFDGVSLTGQNIYIYLYESEFVPVHTMKIIKGVKVQIHWFLTLVLVGDKFSNSGFYCCTSGKEQWYPLNWWLFGPPSQYGHFGEEKCLNRQSCAIRKTLNIACWKFQYFVCFRLTHKSTEWTLCIMKQSFEIKIVEMEF